jgi:hypothetical protein
MNTLSSRWTMTQAHEMLDPEATLAKICTGLSLISSPIKGVPEILELGIRELQAIYIQCKGESLPAGIDKVFRLFEAPLNEWWPQAIPYGDSPLIIFSEPSSLCMDFAVRGRLQLERQLDEIEEHVMLDILRESRLDPIYQHQYVTSRKYIINNPVVSEEKMMKLVVSGKLNSKIRRAYEPIPSNSIKDGYCYLCEYCGDALLWHQNSPICRNWKECCKKGKYANKAKLPVKNLLRVKRGILFFVTLPGKYELELQQKLKENSIDSELWPGVDQYDLGLTIQGKHWAIDVKASKAPKILGMTEAEKGFMSTIDGGPEWERAFYVIPDEYFHYRYISDFLLGAEISERKLKTMRYSVLSESGFIRLVETEQNA